MKELGREGGRGIEVEEKKERGGRKDQNRKGREGGRDERGGQRGERIFKGRGRK